MRPPYKIIRIETILPGPVPLARMSKYQIKFRFAPQDVQGDTLRRRVIGSCGDVFCFEALRVRKPYRNNLGLREAGAGQG